MADDPNSGPNSSNGGLLGTEGPTADRPRRPPRSSPLILAAAIGILALLGGGTVLATRLIGAGNESNAGNDTAKAEAAVSALLAAVGEENLLGALDALPPGEREAFRDSLTGLFDELKELGIVSGDVDPRDLLGLDLTFEGVELTSTPIIDGLMAVTITSGTVETSFDPAKLPLGTFIRDFLTSPSASVEATTTRQEITSQDDDDLIAVVRQDSRWYPSFWYTAAERTRRTKDLPLPEPSQRVEPKGTDSPEEAVKQLIQAADDDDRRRFLELLPPDEARGLHDYAPVFLGEDATADDGFPELTLGGLDPDLVAVREDGKWYVSPIRALFAYPTAVLRALDEANLDQLTAFVGDLWSVPSGVGPDSRL